MDESIRMFLLMFVASAIGINLTEFITKRIYKNKLKEVEQDIKSQLKLEYETKFKELVEEFLQDNQVIKKIETKLESRSIEIGNIQTILENLDNTEVISSMHKRLLNLEDKPNENNTN